MHSHVCEDCDGHGETEGGHMQNCADEDCSKCKSNKECGTCRGDGRVSCNDASCEHEEI